MGVAIVAGSGGLVGSESVRWLVADGYDVIGIDNDMRARFFGPDASTAAVSARSPPPIRVFVISSFDIRDVGGLERLFASPTPGG